VQDRVLQLHHPVIAGFAWHFCHSGIVALSGIQKQWPRHPDVSANALKKIMFA
jgi:hypothetical protein